MSLKRFNADVQAARERLCLVTIPCVTNVERGDSEGEAVLEFVHDALPQPLLIRMLAQNIDEYPDGNNYLVFIDSDDVMGNITTTLEEIQDFTFGQRVFEAAITLSSGIRRALQEADSQRDINMDSVQEQHVAESGSADNYDDEPYDDFDGSDDEVDDYEQFSLPALRPPRSAYDLRMTSDVLRRLRRDLRKAREAGCKVGIMAGLVDSCTTHIICLSVRAGKLGLSQEALEAWDVEASDYIILLIRIDGMYPCSERVVQQASDDFHTQFHFGKCAKYKPSPEQAFAAFADLTKKSVGEDATPSVENDNQGFQKIFISASLEQFMNESFIKLLKLRFCGCATWDDANAELRMRSMSHDDPAKDKEPEPTAYNSTGASQNAEKTLPNILMLDVFAEPDPSVPLIAMQFAIHHFVRCTEYCLRCHRRIDKEFEALKPFVCSDPLCLFQYMTMGFGPSIEYEIITQPYVVDLLISLCYSSVQTPAIVYRQTAEGKYPIREFPSGLRLKAPSTGTEPSMNEVPVKVSVDLGLGAGTFSSDENTDNVLAGTWVVLRHKASPTISPYADLYSVPLCDDQCYTGPQVKPDGQFFHHHAYVKYVDHQTSSFTIDLRHKDPFCPTIDGNIDMDMVVYSNEFDDLTSSDKAMAMVGILNTLPPVSHMREYLIKNPQSKLRSCYGISPSAATLLEWIVASNRSCIFQVSPVADHHAQDKELLATIKTRDQEAIPSMKSCVQFRFVQGAPDKELRFHRALRDVQSQKQTKFPTLFAWHGSSLSNWHSILRQGLDFKETINGRAFGDGVYFSQNYDTSMAYAYTVMSAAGWPQSALNVFGVISLCEIVNAPEKFVSTNPHLVVKQVDWIQCRYLFVQTSGNMNQSAPYTAVVEAIPQDPARPVRGPDSRVLTIPINVIPSGRVARLSQKQPSASPSSKRAHEIVCSSADTDEEDEGDIGYLLSSDDEALEPPSKRLSLERGRDSSVGTATAREVTTQRPLTPPQTDFRPGTLDLGTLPQLPVPEWANPNSTKRLASDIKQMQKVQASTPLHELGWYVDFDKVDNMFQWIVELHSFDPSLPLAKDMKKAGVTSVVLEVRFGREYPFSPPFVRVIRPRFLPFASGGGGHVTIGGAVCLELLTSSGWSPATSMEAVFLTVRMAMSETEPAARLQSSVSHGRALDYGANEALDAYVRFAGVHGWQVPKDLRETAGQAVANV